MSALEWQIARVSALRAETPTVKTLTLKVPRWTRHRAGQHYDVRLVAPDGYEAQRSYSIASAPEQSGEIELTVERLNDGEVSTYLTEVLVVGDEVEVRGPIGGYFVWEVPMGGPLLLVAGGSGIVPLMAILRHRAAVRAMTPVQLLYSVSGPASVIYRDELAALQAAQDGMAVAYTFTRIRPPAWTGYARRIDRAMLAAVSAPLGSTFLAYVCGPTLMVEGTANALVELGMAPERIRTERFGPTGKDTPYE
ncbi:MAG: ferredoxin reductase [Myxococcaceae bacterium]